MKKTYDLTNTELQIMELLWQAEQPMTMGMIEAERGATPYNTYYPTCTKEQHIHNWTKKMVEECYGNSISRLMCALIGEGTLTEQEAEELRKLL